MKKIYEREAPNGLIAEVHHSQKWNDYTVLVRKGARDKGEAVLTTNDKDMAIAKADAQLARQV